MSSLESALQSLPKHIPLPTISRPHRSPSIPLVDVQSAEHLPGRLLLADLGSFEASPKGWTARYEDSEGAETWVEIQFDRGQKRVELRLCWKGNQWGPAIGGFTELGQLSQVLWPHYSFDPKAKSLTEDRWNLQYVPFPEDFPSLVYLPDGIMKTVAFPVPVEALDRVVGFFEMAEYDRRIKTNVHGYLHLGTSVVNYLGGKNSGPFDDADNTFFYELQRWGLPELQYPTWEKGNDESTALTIRRLHYTALITCSFRDLERVLVNLEMSELLSRRDRVTTGPAAYPCAPEDGILVLPQMLEFHQANLSFWDDREKRRVLYPQVGPPMPENPLDLLQPSTPEYSRQGIEIAVGVSNMIREAIESPPV